MFQNAGWKKRIEGLIENGRLLNMIEKDIEIIEDQIESYTKALRSFSNNKSAEYAHMCIFIQSLKTQKEAMNNTRNELLQQRVNHIETILLEPEEIPTKFREGNSTIIVIPKDAMIRQEAIAKIDLSIINLLKVDDDYSQSHGQSNSSVLALIEKLLQLRNGIENNKDSF